MSARTVFFYIYIRVCQLRIPGTRLGVWLKWTAENGVKDKTKVMMACMIAVEDRIRAMGDGAADTGIRSAPRVGFFTREQMTDLRSMLNFVHRLSRMRTSSIS